MRLSLGNLLYGSCGCDFVALWVTGSPFFYVNCYTKLLLPYFCPISDVGSCLFLGTLLFGSRVGRSTLSPCRHEVAPVSGAVALRQRQQLPHFCRIVGIKPRLSRRNLLCSSGRRGSVARRVSSRIRCPGTRSVVAAAAAALWSNAASFSRKLLCSGGRGPGLSPPNGTSSGGRGPRSLSFLAQWASRSLLRVRVARARPAGGRARGGPRPSRSAARLEYCG